MSIQKHYALPVTGLTNPDAAEQAAAALLQRQGVESATASHTTGVVDVHYAMPAITLEDIEHALSEAGYAPTGGWFARMRRNFRHFTEANERANLRSAAAPCCNKPPEPPA